jgi:hypothetical protein
MIWIPLSRLVGVASLSEHFLDVTPATADFPQEKELGFA